MLTNLAEEPRYRKSQAPELLGRSSSHLLRPVWKHEGDTHVEAPDLLEQTLTLRIFPPRGTDPSARVQEPPTWIEEDKVQQIDTKIFLTTALFSLRKVSAVTWFVSLKKKENRRVMI